MVLEKIPTFDDVKNWVNANTATSVNGETGDVTVQSVSDHGQLTGVGANDHHAPYTDTDAQNAVGLGGYLDNRGGSRIGVPTYQSETNLPTGNAGDIAFVIETGQLYVFE